MLVKILLLASMVWAADCDVSKPYNTCNDQGSDFSAAATKAKEAKKPLLLVFGAEWCPWCRSLHSILKEASLPESGNYVIQEIALYEGQEKNPSGMAVLEKVKGMAGKPKVGSGIPFIALVNPTKEKAAFISPSSLQTSSKVTKGYDSTSLFMALKGAEKQVR